MRIRFLTTVAAIAALNIGYAQAQQWNDILQASNAASVPFNGLAATDLAVQVIGADCGAGNSLPTFTAPNVPTLGQQFSPSNCTGTIFGELNINQFARQSDLVALQAQVAAINQFSQKLQIDSLHANQGVAMSLAMAGVGDLQSDEHIAFSGNWGTFQGQNGGAVGVAYRLNEHLSVNAGFAGSLSGGSYGGRAGFRIGW